MENQEISDIVNALDIIPETKQAEVISNLKSEARHAISGESGTDVPIIYKGKTYETFEEAAKDREEKIESLINKSLDSLDPYEDYMDLAFFQKEAGLKSKAVSTLRLLAKESGHTAPLEKAANILFDDGKYDEAQTMIQEGGHRDQNSFALYAAKSGQADLQYIKSIFDEGAGHVKTLNKARLLLDEEVDQAVKWYDGYLNTLKENYNTKKQNEVPSTNPKYAFKAVKQNVLSFYGLAKDNEKAKEVIEKWSNYVVDEEHGFGEPNIGTAMRSAFKLELYGNFSKLAAEAYTDFDGNVKKIGEAFGRINNGDLQDASEEIGYAINENMIPEACVLALKTNNKQKDKLECLAKYTVI